MFDRSIKSGIQTQSGAKIFLGNSSSILKHRVYVVCIGIVILGPLVGNGDPQRDIEKKNLPWSVFVLLLN